MAGRRSGNDGHVTDEQERAERVVRELGQTFAEQAGITLADKPSPLYRLLVLSTLLSARISADIAVAAARELSRSGFRTPQAMNQASWQERVDALGRGHYRRYDERTATMLGDGAELLLNHYDGDLRRLHEHARDVADLENKLRGFPGIGPSGSAIFCREVQGVWPDIAPYADSRVTAGAAELGLPTSAAGLGALVAPGELPRLMAACVRVGREPALAERILQPPRTSR